MKNSTKMRRNYLIVLAGVCLAGPWMAIGESGPQASRSTPEVEITKIIMRADARAFGVELKNNTIDGQNCTLDFNLHQVPLDSSPEEKATVTTYQVTLPIAYHDQKSYFQDLRNKDLGRAVVQDGYRIKQVELKKRSCSVILPMVSAGIHRGKKGFIYVAQNIYSGRDYICSAEFKMFFNHQIVDQVKLLPFRVNKGDNYVENHPRGTAFFNSHAAAFKDLELQKVEVAEVKCQVVKK